MKRIFLLCILAALSSSSQEFRELASLSKPAVKRISECYAYSNTYFCNHKNRDVDITYGVQGWCCPLDDEDSNIPECQSSTEDEIVCNAGKEALGMLFYYNNVEVDQKLCGFYTTEGGDFLSPKSYEQDWEVSGVLYSTLSYPVYDESCYFQMRVEPTYATGVVNQDSFVTVDFEIVAAEVYAWSGLYPDEQGSQVSDEDGTIYNGNQITFGMYDQIQIIYHPNKNVDADDPQPYLHMKYVIAEAVWDETLVVVEEESEPEPEPVVEEVVEVEVEDEPEEVEEVVEVEVEEEEEEEETNTGLQLSDNTIFYIQIGIAIWCGLMLLCGIVYCGSKCITITKRPKKVEPSSKPKPYTGKQNNEDRFRTIDQKNHGTQKSILQDTEGEDGSKIRMSSIENKDLPYVSDSAYKTDDKPASRVATKKLKLNQIATQDYSQSEIKSTQDRNRGFTKPGKERISRENTQYNRDLYGHK